MPVRELENLFLDEDVVLEALVERCELIGCEPPDGEAVGAALGALYSQQEDRRLFCDGETNPESIAGSEVLDRVYWELSQSEYDKVADGARLASLTLSLKPERLEPLIAVIRDLGEGLTGGGSESESA